MIKLIGYPMIFYSDDHHKEYDPHELSDQIIVNHRVFNQLLQYFDNENVLFMNLIHKKTSVSYLVTLGSPHNENENMVFIPEWIMEYMNCLNESDPEFYVEKATMDISIAEKIRIRIMDMDVLDGDMDVCGYFERALKNLHSIQEGLTLPIYMEECDQNILAYIEKVEPSICSKIITGEVEVEFVSTTEESISSSSSSSLSSSFDSLSEPFTSFSSSPVSTIQVPPNTPLLSSFSSPSDSQPFSLSSFISQPTIIEEKNDHQDTFYERQQKIRESWAKRFS